VWSPEKGGGLREQRTGGRRLLAGSLLSAGLVVAPLLLLGTGMAPRAAGGPRAAAAVDARPHRGLLGGLSLAFEAPATTTSSTAAPVTSTTLAPPTTTEPPLAPRVVATVPSADGLATWYAAAPAGRCASPWLPFGTVLTVTDLSTGASISCVVDDREAAGYPHVVDLSPSGFASLAPLGQGTIEVEISW
jgi:hypothetical protein